VAESVAEIAGRESLEHSISGLSNVISVGEAGFAVKEGIAAARQDDWKEFSGAMGELAIIGPNMATHGGFGAALGVWDATAAVLMAHGGPDFSVGTALREIPDQVSTWFEEQYFDVINGNYAADHRINPNGPEESHSFASDVHFHQHQPTVFEPQLVTPGSAGGEHTGGHAHHHHHSAGEDMVFEPELVTANTAHDHMVITIADELAAGPHMVITIADEIAAAGPHIYDQLLSNAPDFNTAGLHFGQDLGTIPDGVGGHGAGHGMGGDFSHGGDIGLHGGHFGGADGGGGHFGGSDGGGGHFGGSDGGGGHFGGGADSGGGGGADSGGGGGGDSGGF
jgi:hypothetical protein